MLSGTYSGEELFEWTIYLGIKKAEERIHLTGFSKGKL